MTTTFPLYDVLVKECTKKDKRDPMDLEKDMFLEFIKSVDKEGAEAVYTLITIYFIKQQRKLLQGSGIIKVPYKGKRSGEPTNTTVEFDFNNFPKTLQKMLIRFSELHRKK